MKNTIPQSSFWIYISVILLPLNGGFINAATLISFLHNSVGYVTGNLAYAGTYYAEENYVMFLKMILLIFSFLLGSIISGLIIKNEYYNKDHRYSANLILQLLLVAISIYLMRYNLSYCGYLLAATMGLQNSMTTHYGSALIRTTHMTGTVTDLGILISYWLKRKHVSFWKIKIYLILIISFLIGSIVGALCFFHFQENSLFVSILIYLIMIAISKK
ncbi:DUF1275 domain-containing protein [Thiotrichales bacterium 19S9-12]|nr:DUF1275 domain-containing protein [Thiotrichales bacterium 19S9-12]